MAGMFLNASGLRNVCVSQAGYETFRECKAREVGSDGYVGRNADTGIYDRREEPDPEQKMD